MARWSSLCWPCLAAALLVGGRLEAGVAGHEPPEYLKRAVVYQLVLRTFTRDGTFAAAKEMLGHAIMAWCFLKAQGVPAIVSEVALDAVTGAVTRSENATVREVAKTADGITCTVLAKSLPFPVPPEAMVALAEFAVEETLNREVFAVCGLKDGDYTLSIEGVEVARADAVTLAKGLRLGFNPKTPQYVQAQEFFARNAALAAREREMRNSHSARWAYGQRGAPVDDVKAFAEWFEKSEPNKDAYFAKFVPGYLAYWPHYRETREKLLADQRQACALVKPVAHRYEVKRVNGAAE